MSELCPVCRSHARQCGKQLQPSKIADELEIYSAMLKDIQQNAF